MNQGDTELLLGKLEKAGHKIVEKLEDSEIVIVNTCAVKRTTLNRVIYRLKELHEKTDKKVIVAGCLPLIDYEKIEKIGEFAGIISCLTVNKVDEVVRRISEGEKGIKIIKGHSEKLSESRYRTNKISAPVSIAEGCVSNCSYCCVKFARGKLRSFDPEKIVKEVKTELERGRKEIYITTQDTAAYGIDLEGKTDLCYLLERLSSIPGDFKIRVGMMNPKNAKRLMPNLLRFFDSDKVYDFLHLPVQSGNNNILQKMNRDYTVEDFTEIVKSFREKFSDLYLATDIIVGFPGESNEAFEDSCDLLKEIRPDKVNLTRFTPMPGTEAKNMEQVRSEEKKRRSKRMTTIHKGISLEINKKYVGRVEKGLVLKEGKKGGYEARLKNYKPIIIDQGDPGDFVEIEITEAKPTYLMGKNLGVIK